MEQASSEEQLLFGVLAVQLRFASPAQVMAAGAAWMADRNQGLAERLEAAGAITPRQREMVESMLAEAIRVSGGNASETLDAMGGQAIIQHSFAGSLVLDGSGEVRPGDSPEAVRSDDATTTQPDRADPSTSLVLPPDSPDRYLFRGEHGRGGQAKVLVAFDQNVGREIAWKEMLADRGGGSTASEGLSRTTMASGRFLREARITGQLEHPNIVPVYELGEKTDGQPYYTMRLVRGQTLASKLRECDGLDDRMKLLGSVWDMCKGIAYAHSRGVIHRDVKPDNVIVGEFGETVILDWGLAKAKGADDPRASELERQVSLMHHWETGQTVDGSAMGTPSYMSPEQAEGDLERIDERSDVWGLGAVLYELLTGQPPHTGETPFEIVGRVMKDDVRPVAQICPQAPSDLAAVADKALRRDPDARYQSARELAGEVSAYMTGKRVGAYSYSSLELLRRFAARNKALVAALTGLLVVIALSWLGMHSSLEAESRAHRLEQAARARAQQERIAAQHRLAQAFESRAVSLQGEWKLLSARVYAAASLAFNPAYPASRHYDVDFAREAPQARDLAVRARSLLDRDRYRAVEGLVQTVRVGGPVSDMAISADGRLLAAIPFQDEIRVWRFPEMEEVFHVPGRAFATYGVAFFPDGKRIVTCGFDPSLQIWELGKTEPVLTIEDPPPVIHAVAVSPDGLRLAAPVAGNRIAVWSAADGRELLRFDAHDKPINALSFLPDGEHLASAGLDGTVRLFDARTGKPIWKATGHEGRIYSLALSADGSTLASASTDRTVRLWDANTGKSIGQVGDPTDGFYTVALSPDGKFVAAGGANYVVSLWDLDSGWRQMVLEGHVEVPNSMLFSPDGAYLISGAYDNTIRVWRNQVAPRLRRYRNPATIYTLDFHPGTATLVAGDSEGKVEVWPVEGTGPGRVIAELPNPITRVAFSPDGKRIAVAARLKGVSLRDAATGAEVARFTGFRGSARGLSFSPDGTRLATGTGGKEVRIWEVVAEGTNAEPLVSFDGFGTFLFDVAFSADGRSLYAVGGRPEVVVIDAASGEEIAVWKGHRDFVSDILVLPGGRDVATAGKDGTVIVWDAATGRVRLRLGSGRHPVAALAADPAGHWLAASMGDDAIMIWELSAGRLIARIPVRFGSGRLFFTQGRSELVVAISNHLVFHPLALEPPADPEPLLEQAQRQAGMNLEGFDLVARPPADLPPPGAQQ